VITKRQFESATKKFDKSEGRGSFYGMAIHLIDKGFKVEAYCLILSTWNFARFRYFVKRFGFKKLNDTLLKLKPYFNKLKNKKFRTINLDKHRFDIKRIFKKLSRIKGIEYVGASKIMHLINRNLFVMWDNYIRGAKRKFYYKSLAKNCWQYGRPKKYKKDGNGYFEFLKDNQRIFKDIGFHQTPRKTFAKAIDEYNYANITLPIQKLEKKAKKKKQRGK